MKEPKVLVTMKDIQRYKIIKDVLEKRFKGVEASEILGITPVHFSRLKKKVKLTGINGLLRKNRQSPNKKIDKLAEEVAKLYEKYYWDFNVMHFKEKLWENHKIKLSYESVRKVLIIKDLHKVKKKRIVHRQRRRMPKAGMLVQMDSSQHNWLPHIKEKWWLIVMIDDATNEVPYAKFFPKDTLFANMHVIRRFIEKKGLFVALYADKASHFKTTRHGGLHYTVNPEQDETQIERALEELDITFIPANSPQAKGRVERLFRLFQDRLIKEMRLAGIKNYHQANKFLLNKFLPWHKKRFSIEGVESVYRALPVEKNLDTVFCIKKERKVNSDNTMHVQGQVIQIPPSKLHLSFAGRKVNACILENNSLLVLYKGNIICKSKLSKNNKILKKEKKIEKILNLREYTTKPKKKYIPPPDHPWRLQNKVLFNSFKNAKQQQKKLNILA